MQRVQKTKSFLSILKNNAIAVFFKRSQQLLSFVLLTTFAKKVFIFSSSWPYLKTIEQLNNDNESCTNTDCPTE